MSDNAKKVPRGAGAALKTLNRITVLKDLAPEALEELEAVTRWREYEANQEIFDADDPSGEVYFILHGSVRVVNYSTTGRQIGFGDCGPGGIFGELSAIDGEPRSASVFAQSKCTVGIVDRATFIKILQEHPGVSLRMLVYLVDMIRKMNEQVLNISAASDVQKVYYELLRLAEPNPDGDGSWLIFNMPRHKDLAELVGTTSETVAHAVSQLMRAELAKRRSGRLELLDRDRIRQLALMG